MTCPHLGYVSLFTVESRCRRGSISQSLEGEGEGGRQKNRNRICMHRSVPEYKQRIIRGHKVTVSCYVAWRRVRVRGARGMKVWLGWREQDETLFPLTLTLASSEPVLLTSKGAPSPVFSFQQPLRRGKFQFIRGRTAPTSQWNTYISASLLRHFYPPANGLQVGKLIPGTLFHYPLRV